VTRLQALAIVTAILTVGRPSTWLGVVAFGCLALDMLPNRPLRRRPTPEDPA
jgi:hypothetical protein